MEDPKLPPGDKPGENEISDYVDGVRNLQLQGYETGIKKARTALFVTAGLLLLSEIITASVSGIEWTPLLIAIVVVEVGIFVALGFWTKTRPYAAIMLGLVIFILYWLAGIILVDSSAIYKGIIFKIVIIIYLAQAIKPAKEWEETKKNMK